MALAVVTSAAVVVATFSEIANRLARVVAFQAAVMALAASPSRMATRLAAVAATIATAMTTTTAITATVATTVFRISGSQGE